MFDNLTQKHVILNRDTSSGWLDYPARQVVGIVLGPRILERHGPRRMNNIYLRWLFIMCFFVNCLIFPYPKKSHSIIFIILDLSSFFFFPLYFSVFLFSFRRTIKPLPLPPSLFASTLIYAFSSPHIFSSSPFPFPLGPGLDGVIIQRQEKG